MPGSKFLKRLKHNSIVLIPYVGSVCVMDVRKVYGI